MNTEYICLAHIRLWNWQSACSGHLNRAGIRELTGQGRASYLWTWKSNCIFFSLRILLRDPDSLNPRKTVLLLYGGGAGAAHGLLNLCVPKGDHQLPLRYKLRHGVRPPAKLRHSFFVVVVGSPAPLVSLGIPPPPLFSVRQDTTPAGFMPLRPAPTWSRLRSRLKSASLAANVASFCGNYRNPLWLA